ncbi:MAG: GGDEF domain-containing protein [Oscillospiraceae bacterium]|jgi:diguanylate cyclase (GGDEF)-like protein|nr:GGDEF domain-containing protein [Oscillospiraceae bacterium]
MTAVVNIFKRTLSAIVLEDDQTVSIRFGILVLCFFSTAIATGFGIYFFIKGMWPLVYAMLIQAPMSVFLFFYCRTNRPEACRVTYLVLCVSVVMIHFLLTHYLGNCGSVAYIAAAILPNHFFPVLQKKYVPILDALLILSINGIFWYGLVQTPVYTGMNLTACRLFIINCALLVCSFELYYNAMGQQLVKARQQARLAQAAREASVDALTGLGNRRMLEDRRQELEQSAQTGTPVCISMLDIDFFKQINDTYGHDVGDQVLVYLANTMHLFFRKSDILVRWGGEEFLIALCQTELRQAEELMERFRLTVQQAPLLLSGHQIHIRLTIGLAMLLPPHRGLDDTVRAADARMYQGKLEGRNRVITLD